MSAFKCAGLRNSFIHFSTVLQSSVGTESLKIVAVSLIVAILLSLLPCSISLSFFAHHPLTPFKPLGVFSTKAMFAWAKGMYYNHLRTSGLPEMEPPFAKAKDKRGESRSRTSSSEAAGTGGVETQAPPRRAGGPQISDPPGSGSFALKGGDKTPPDRATKHFGGVGGCKSVAVVDEISNSRLTL